MSLEPRALDSLRLHSAADRIPMANRSDLDALRSSLRENGQQDPIDVSGDVILDGRTRWMLLRELGTITVQVRQVEMPESQQTGYIIDRALARRHLTADQKQALNALLAETVVEVTPHPVTGEEMRIGKTVRERAETLGVDATTIRAWDEASPRGFPTGDTAPTHVRHSDGKVQPIRHPARRAPGSGSARDVRAGRTGPPPARVVPKPKRSGPPWHRHFTLWCRAVLPEDRKYLLQMSEELHKALGRLDLACGKQEEVA